MLDGKLFDKLVRMLMLSCFFYDTDQDNQEFVGRALRKNPKPFGGIQVSRWSIIFQHSITEASSPDQACIIRRLLPATARTRQGERC